MKKIFISILIALSINCYSQITPSQLPFRVVTVSPNFPNVYPRFRTLQSTWTALKDSASVSTGKYFIINVTTSYNNISDWTSTYKDSMINRDPYMKVVAFGQAITDSIIGVTTQEFNLVAGILSLNSATAGDGLSFSGHEYMVNTGIPLYITNDTIYIHYWSQDFFMSGTSLRLFKTTNSGIQETNSGIQVLPRLPMATSGDTVLLKWYPPLGLQAGKYLTLLYNTDMFNVASDSTLVIKSDSGLAVSTRGLYIARAGNTLDFFSGSIRVNPMIAGNGLNWYPTNGDSLNVGIGNGLTFDATGKIISVRGATTQFSFGSGFYSGQLILLVDSGLTAGITANPTKPKVSVDYNTINFSTSGQVQINPLLAGDGLGWSSYALYILHNDFANIQNDTLKLRTSATWQWYMDSLTANFTYCKPFDTVGVPTFAVGKVKRCVVAYKTKSNNDSVLTASFNASFVSNDRVQLYWNNALNRFEIYTVSSGGAVANFPIYNFATNRHWVFSAEVWEEAQ